MRSIRGEGGAKPNTLGRYEDGVCVCVLVLYLRGWRFPWFSCLLLLTAQAWWQAENQPVKFWFMTNHQTDFRIIGLYWGWRQILYFELRSTVLLPCLLSDYLESFMEMCYRKQTMAMLTCYTGTKRNHILMSFLNLCSYLVVAEFLQIAYSPIWPTGYFKPRESAVSLFSVSLQTEKGLLVIN